jgi:fructose-1,6-bisphosphatase I
MAKKDKLMTLSRHIREQERLHPSATGVFSNLLEHMSLAAKLISREVTKAGLVEILGLTGETNVQGEEVKKLDVYANDTMIRMMDHCGYLSVMASEEVEDVIPIPGHHEKGKYVLLFDPLDGSSNIDANVSIGTIFSILRKRTLGDEDGTLQDCLQPGTAQVAAGYVIYGSSTMLVYTTGQGVHGFTLDPSVGEFILSHPDIRIPRRGKIFSVNMGNWERWDEGVRKYLRHVMSEDKPGGRPYSLRYIGSLCSDFHRNLLYGGIFLYPADKKSPKGKLRLLYEANPMGFVVEQAGGKASSGTERILEIEPQELHQRTGLIIGSADDVTEAEEFIQGKRG